MNIQTISITRLIPAPYNPRKPLKPGTPGYRRLERSLREFELVQPLVWNERTGHLVAGHQRLEILKARGATDVEVVVVNLTPAREKALNVALNNSLVGGEWDAGRLIDVVQELQASPDIDVALTGFDGDELRDLLLSPEEHLAAEENNDADQVAVHVQFDVPAEQWEAVRSDLDPLLAEHGIRVHVRLPSRRRWTNEDVRKS